MSTTEIKSFIEAIEETQGTDKTDINFIKSVADGIKKDADLEIATETKQATAQVDAEYKEMIDALIAERNAIKAALSENKAEIDAKNKAEHDRYISFFSIAKQMTQTLLASAAGKYIDMEWNIDKKLDRLEAVGIDTLDNETYALMFQDEERISIASYADFNRVLETVKHVNKHIMIDKEFDKAVNSFKAIAEVNVDSDYYANITDALATFTGQINACAEKHEMGEKEAYALFFYNKKDSLGENTIATLADFNAYKAELMTAAQGADIAVIQGFYQELKSVNYSADNFVGTLQSNTLAIKDMVTTISERYGISADDVCAQAFDSICVTNEAGLDAKLLAHSYDINIRDILNNISTLKIAGDTEISPELIEKMSAVDLSENRLKVAGVSDATAAEIGTLKTAFITALNDNAPTREIEYALGTTAIHAHSEMNTKHLKYLCQLTA